MLDFASGHNHYSMAVHLGGKGDTRLADEILAFLRDATQTLSETR